MLTYVLHPHSRTPLYAQLYACLRRDMAQGTLRAGDKLPSKRRLAEQLQISVITVEAAYAQLQAEGYLVSRERSGYYVCALDPAPVPQAPVPPALSTGGTAADSLPGEAGGTGRSPDISRLSSDGSSLSPSVERSRRPGARVGAPEPDEWFCDFRQNGIDAGAFPFSSWARLLREVLSEERGRLLDAVDPQGVPALREQIAAYLYQFRGMTVSPEQILIGAGTEYLYGLLVQLLGRDRVFAVENPGYPKIARIYAQNGARCRFVPLDDSGVSVAALRESGADVVHISPSHQFPTGLVMPVGRRQELLRWADEAPGRVIIEDDYDSEFRLCGRPIPALQSIDRTGRVIYTNTFTKSLAPSLRIGYMVLPPALLRAYRDTLGFYACTVPSFEQYTLAKFMADGHFERHIHRRRTAYRARRDQLLRCIADSPLHAVSAINEQHAGLHFLLLLRSPLSDRELTAAAAAHGVRVACLSEYWQTAEPAVAPTAKPPLPLPGQPADTHTFVMCYSGVRPDRLEEAVRRLCVAWQIG